MDLEIDLTILSKTNVLESLKQLYQQETLTQFRSSFCGTALDNSFWNVIIKTNLRNKEHCFHVDIHYPKITKHIYPCLTNTLS